MSKTTDASVPIYKYYLLKLNSREIMDYAETIEDAVEKCIASGRDWIIVTPVTWKMELTDQTNNEVK